MVTKTIENVASYREALATAIDAASEAGAVLRAELHRPGGPRGGGGKCPADAEAEAVIRRKLAAAFPDYGVRGEELGGEDRASREPARHVWLVDPNDGTSAFLKGHRGSCVSIGLLRAGRPVLGVVFAFAAPDDSGDLFAWAEGCGPVTRNGATVPRDWPAELGPDHTVIVSQDADGNPAANAHLCSPARFRALPSIAYRLALAAAGEGDAAVSLAGPGDWDYAAGHALLLGAGGDLLDAAGAPVKYAADGRSRCGGRCFGGPATVARALAGKVWEPVFSRAKEEADPYPLVRPVKGKLAADAGRLSRAQGCLLGQFAGDALGGLVEFRDVEHIAAEFPDGVKALRDGGHWRTLGGQPTDDSEMALMLARSVVARGAFDPAHAARAYGHWYDSRPFDMGGTTATALSAVSAAIAAGRDPVAAAALQANKESQANGALMRVSPLGVFAHAVPPEQAAAWARADAALTHPHETCRDAGALFAATLAHAVRIGEDPEAVFAFAKQFAADPGVCPDVRRTLAAAETRPPADFSSQMGWVLIALQNAFYRLLYSGGPEKGIVDTVMCGGDTDTNAAIAGALLGAVHGRDAIPRQWRDRVLTSRPIRGVSDVRRPRPRAFWPVDALELAERLLVSGSTHAAGESGPQEKNR